MPRKRLLVINPLWPEESLPHQAATLVLYQLTSEFARSPEIEVGFLKIDTGFVSTLNEVQDSARKALNAKGVTFLDPLVLPTPPPARSIWRRMVLPRLEDYYPETLHQDIAYKAASAFDPDFIFVPWSEPTTCLFSKYPAKRFTYFGNPDPWTARIEIENARRNGNSFLSYFAGRLFVGWLERFHIREMARWDFVADVSLNCAEYYRSKLGPRAFYINNLWIDRYGEAWRETRDQKEIVSPLRIVGNIGFLTSTANSMGLEILGRDLMPELRRVFPDGGFEVHIYGGGKPKAALKSTLEHPEIKIRGFVEDIDSEMLESPIFLCVNNASRYSTGHTRYLHAWSLGCCVVAHSNAALSMPEIEHGFNALLGDSPQEIADLIARAAGDQALRRRLGENGYRTLKERFKVETVVDTALQKFNS